MDPLHMYLLDDILLVLHDEHTYNQIQLQIYQTRM
jgi:hypothetical protein